MNKYILVFGLFMPLEILWGRNDAYDAGYAFRDVVSLASLPGFLLFLVFVVFLILIPKGLWNWRQKPESRRDTMGLLFFVVLAIGTTVSLSPFPTQIDGMKQAVIDKLDRDRLIHLARELRALEAEDNPKRLGLADYTAFAGEQHQKKIDVVRPLYPQAFDMSEWTPRFWISESFVTFYYGGALPGHWGYSITEDDECPHTAWICERAMKNVWVMVID